jgi:hypothetical protein
MKTLFLLSPFIFLVAGQSSLLLTPTSPYYNLTAVDSELHRIQKTLLDEEALLKSMILNLTGLINSTLTSIQSKPSFSQVSLMKLLEFLIDLMTVSSYWEYEQFSSCSDINMKITNLELNWRTYTGLLVEIAANNTWLAYNTNIMAGDYLIRQYQLDSIQIASFQKIIQDSIKLQLEYANYARMLASAMTFEVTILANLKIFRSKYCICSNSSSIAPTSNLESNLNYIENPLITRQSKIVNISKVAKDQVNNIKMINNLQIQSFANAITPYLDIMSNLNDYKISNLTITTSCNEIITRLAMIMYKYKQYLQIQTKTIGYRTTLIIHIGNLNSTFILNNQSLTDVQRKNVQNLANSLTNLFKEFNSYITELIMSSTKMLTVQIDVEFISDTYCGCTDGFTTTTPTTSTTTIPRN